MDWVRYLQRTESVERLEIFRMKLGDEITEEVDTTVRKYAAARLAKGAAVGAAVGAGVYLAVEYLFYGYLSFSDHYSHAVFNVLLGTALGGALCCRRAMPGVFRRAGSIADKYPEYAGDILSYIAELENFYRFTPAGKRPAR